MSRLVTPVFQFLTPGRNIRAITTLTDTLKNILASILRNALTELEGTLSANMTNNDVGDPHGVSVGTSSIRERASDDFR